MLPPEQGAGGPRCSRPSPAGTPVLQARPGFRAPGRAPRPAVPAHRGAARAQPPTSPARSRRRRRRRLQLPAGPAHRHGSGQTAAAGTTTPSSPRAPPTLLYTLPSRAAGHAGSCSPPRGLLRPRTGPGQPRHPSRPPDPRTGGWSPATGSRAAGGEGGPAPGVGLARLSGGHDPGAGWPLPAASSTAPALARTRPVSPHHLGCGNRSCLVPWDTRACLAASGRPQKARHWSGLGRLRYPLGLGNSRRFSRCGAGSCPEALLQPSGSQPPPPPTDTSEAPGTCRPRSLTSGQRRSWPRARCWHTQGAHMVNAGRPRCRAHIWQWEGCAPRPAPLLPPLLSRKCISAQAEGEEAAGAGGSSRSVPGRLCPVPRGWQGSTGGML